MVSDGPSFRNVYSDSLSLVLTTSSSSGLKAPSMVVEFTLPARRSFNVVGSAAKQCVERSKDRAMQNNNILSAKK